MRARSVQTALPAMSLPSHTDSGELPAPLPSSSRQLAAEDVAEVDHAVALVGHLDADRLLAGDRREDADVGGGERVGDVVLQLGDLRDLGAGREAQLVARHARAGDLPDHLGLDAEVAQRLDQQLGDLVLVGGVGALALGRVAQQLRLGQRVAEALGLGHGGAALALRREERRIARVLGRGAGARAPCRWISRSTWTSGSSSSRSSASSSAATMSTSPVGASVGLRGAVPGCAARPAAPRTRDAALARVGARALELVAGAGTHAVGARCAALRSAGRSRRR